jgi:hypothetical protein
MSVEDTLAERGARYGDFTDHARLCQDLQRVMRDFIPNDSIAARPWFSCLNDVQRQALTVIADKIARILSGDPNYADNWHDIQGYAKLVEDRLPKKELAQSSPKCATCNDNGVIGCTSGQTPETFEQGEAPCPDCAQPSPAPEIEPIPEIPMTEFKNRWLCGHMPKVKIYSNWEDAASECIFCKGMKPNDN